MPPEFTGRTLEEQTVSLAGLRGKVVLLNFWASWCLECRPEMPALEELHRKYASRGLAVLGINAREGRDTAGRFARELALTFPLVLDHDGAVSTQYGVIGLPTTFLIGRDGRAVALAIGPRDWGGAAADGIIRSLLLDPPATRGPR
jgi:peroxiredoxin